MIEMTVYVTHPEPKPQFNSHPALTAVWRALDAVHWPEGFSYGVRLTEEPGPAALLAELETDEPSISAELYDQVTDMLGVVDLGHVADVIVVEVTGCRLAHCTYCKRAAISGPHLAFFEDQTRPKHCAECGKYADPHDPAHERYVGHAFVPRQDPGTDRYYCGCRGWS